MRDVHWDVDELDEVANEAHDRETNSNSLGDLHELCIRLSGLSTTISLLRGVPFCDGFVHRVRNCKCNLNEGRQFMRL